MFLTIKNYTIPDFLTALNFIPPKGMKLDYILSPNTISTEALDELGNSGYTEKPIQNLTNVKYLKKDLKQTHSFSPIAQPIENPSLLPSEMPKAKPIIQDDIITKNNTIMTPKRGIIIAEKNNYENERSYILRENFCGIPKNTIFVMR